MSQSSLLALLCNNRGLKNLNLSACPNILGDEVRIPQLLTLLPLLQVCLVLASLQPSLTCLDLWRCSTLTARGVTALASCTLLQVPILLLPPFYLLPTSGV